AVIKAFSWKAFRPVSAKAMGTGLLARVDLTRAGGTRVTFSSESAINWMAVSILKLMAPPANLPFCIRSFIATVATPYSAINSAKVAWNVFRSSRLWFFGSDSLRTLQSGRLNWPRSIFSMHTTASLPVSSTPHTIIIMPPMPRLFSAAAFLEFESTTASAGVVAGGGFCCGDRSRFVQDSRELVDGFNGALAGINGDRRVKFRRSHLSLNFFLARFTGNHQR